MKSLGRLDFVPSLSFEKSNPTGPMRFEKSEKDLKKEKLETFGKICSKIEEHLYLSGERVASNRSLLKECKITHVINCAGSCCDNFFPEDFTYTRLHLADGNFEDISCYFLYVIEIVQTHLDNNQSVLFHCQQGVSRSASFLIMYLMWRDRKPFDDIFNKVKSIRGICNPNLGFLSQLVSWGKRLGIGAAVPPALWLMMICPHGTDSEEGESYVARNVEPQVSSFDPRGVFLLCSEEAIYTWIGTHSAPTLKQPTEDYIHRLQKYMGASSTVITFCQGEEPQAFSDHLNGCPSQPAENSKYNKHFSIRPSDEIEESSTTSEVK